MSKETTDYARCLERSNRRIRMEEKKLFNRPDVLGPSDGSTSSCNESIVDTCPATSPPRQNGAMQISHMAAPWLQHIPSNISFCGDHPKTTGLINDHPKTVQLSCPRYEVWESRGMSYTNIPTQCLGTVFESLSFMAATHEHVARNF